MKITVTICAALLLTGCCGGVNKSLFGASDSNCGRPVYRAPECAGRTEVPGAAPQVEMVPFWEVVRWPWQCDESKRGQPVYKAPDCATTNAKVKGFFSDLNNKMFGCETTPAAAPPPCK